MFIHWYETFPSGELIDLNQIDFARFNADGVYVIYAAGGLAPFAVRVGQGDIADRLCAHRSDNAVSVYEHWGLKVAYAQLPSVFKDGVEAFLFDTLHPAVGTRRPYCPRMEVNLPSPFAAMRNTGIGLLSKFGGL